MQLYCDAISGHSATVHSWPSFWVAVELSMEVHTVHDRGAYMEVHTISMVPLSTIEESCSVHPHSHISAQSNMAWPFGAHYCFYFC